MEKFSFNQEALIQKYQPDFAMAYGSGIKPQEGYKQEDQPMLDFILGVDNPKNWHTSNLKNQPEDYSQFATILGSELVDYLQNIGAKIYYNHTEFEDRKIKYGVLSVADLIQDLEEWSYLYAAGRLQKPVEILKITPEIRKAMQSNLDSALITALLLLPENFTEEDLYMTIAGISYTGDSRMKFGENPQKVKNIVKKNLEGFRILYRNIMVARRGVFTTLNGDQIQQDISPNITNALYSQLPKNLWQKVAPFVFKERDYLSKIIRQRISQIVKSPSLVQTAKGILTAGAQKSLAYALEKIKKSCKKISS